MYTFSLQNFDRAWHLYYYLKKGSMDYITQQLMDFKSDKKAQLTAFSQIAGEVFKELNLSVDYIIRVLGSKELTAQQPNRVRNVAMAIHKAIGGHYHPLLLKKNRPTKPLKPLPLSLRISELDGVYEMNQDINLNERSVLVIDDIITTGTSLRSIAELLKNKYPRITLYCFCLAKTVSLEYDGISFNTPEKTAYYKNVLQSIK